MDPNAAFQCAIDESRPADRRRDCASALSAWLTSGGFMPTLPEGYLSFGVDTRMGRVQLIGKMTRLVLVLDRLTCSQDGVR